MSRPTIGIVGLGLMGRSVSQRLLDADYTVWGFDLDGEARDRFARAGGHVGDSPAAVAETADIVISSLPTPAIVEAVYLADDGIQAGATPGTIACEMSTIDPATTRRIAGAVDRIQLLDTPVSGGPEDAARGSLMVIGGGDEATFHRDDVQAVLGTLGQRVYYAGPVGAGHTVKLLNNVMSAGNLLLAMEVISLGVASGVEAETLNEILPTTGGSSKQLEKRLPRVLNRNFEPGFTVGYARKDVGLAVDYAESLDIPLQLSAFIHRLYIAATAAGFDGDDMCSTVKLFEEHTAIPVEADEPVDETFEGY